VTDKDTTKTTPAKTAPKEEKPAPATTEKASTPAAKAPAKKTTAPAKKSAPSAKKAPAKKASPAKASDSDVKIVEPEEAAAKEYKPKAKPALDDATKALLNVRREIDARRPAFRRQQWFEYKRLEDSGWRKPRGKDSAMRRHFGYRPNLVSIGFRGPVDVRGLHSSGFEEVRVENVNDLAKVDPKTQAARVSATVGRRKLKLIYEAADKQKIRILNRREI
jgi:large subunit ribosomal protein L32e